MEFEFVCTSCNEVHRGMPSFGANAPFSYEEIPSNERNRRATIGSDDCIIDEQWFFVRGCLEIPVHGYETPFIWGVWVSLSKESFAAWAAHFHTPKRSHIGPFFGWLNTSLSPYPETLNLKTMLHLRDDGQRPFIELEPTDHPLSVEQREGISPERVMRMHAQLVHGAEI